MTTPVVTRFAPSPTGYLHIGGARTALFNWLYARSRGGIMHLRIEDTDRTRSTEPAIQAIMDGLKWLELEWDGEPVFQFARADRHRAVAEALLARGAAYRCYCTAEDLEAMRERAKAEGRSPGYDGTWRDRDASDAPKGVPHVIRLKAPRTGETVIDDQVQGRVVFQNENLDDLIILRSDGTPTYNLSVVADDHDMAVTHIIRGDDHLTNAARQAQIYKAMDWDTPIFAHVPLIHGADGAKLSKRHGALGVEAYRAMGYLPAALRNYLVRLGWSHGDDEIFSTEDLISVFDLPAIGRSAARFDFAKLEHINGLYIRSTPEDALLQRVLDILPEVPGAATYGHTLKADDIARLKQALPGLKDRAKTLVELIDNAAFLFAERPIAPDAAASALLTADARSHLASLADHLSDLPDWSVAALEEATKHYADAHALKLGKIAQPLRAALTGRTTSPSVFDVMTVLGKAESLGRIRDQSAPPT